MENLAENVGFHLNCFNFLAFLFYDILTIIKYLLEYKI